MNYAKETILIVDDSHFQRTVIKDVLSDQFNLIEASSGGECMRIIEENAAGIDLVVLDLVMPGIDGFEVLRRRQSMQEFLDIPIVVLTTSDSYEIQSEVYALEANDFIVKPIDDKVALSRIRNLLKSKSRVRSLIQKYIEFKVKSELDEMTGLFNKTTIISLINNALLEHMDERHVLLVVDIDNFKAVNDVYGHAVGDHMLSIVSNAIISQFNGADFVGRIGGDEFVIFVQNVSDKEEIYQKTNSLIRIMSDREVLSIPDDVTLSIGLAFTDGSEYDYAALFSKADKALYTSKHAGKSCYSEYGAQNVTQTDCANTIQVMSKTRNVFSMIEFAYPSQTEIVSATSFDVLMDNIFHSPDAVSCVYIDISEEQDNGVSILENLSKVYAGNYPVVIICREGSMEQMRIAVSYSFTTDVLFSPLETDTLKRRVAKHAEAQMELHK